MKLVDARSGREVRPGETVRYTDGAWWRCVRILDAGPFSLRSVYVDVVTDSNPRVVAVPSPVHWFGRHGVRYAVFPS